jgi:hypothetical protein
VDLCDRSAQQDEYRCKTKKAVRAKRTASETKEKKKFTQAV